jgi:hypothetical protein
MYNGQFYKGLIHVAIFAGLIGLESAGLPPGLDAVFGMGIAFWYIYMIVDANRTAQAKYFGRPLPDPFGFERMFGGSTAATAPEGAPLPPPPPNVVYPAGSYGPAGPVSSEPYGSGPPCRQSSPVGPIILIGLGVLFLLNQFGWWHFHWFGRMWPLVLIGLGVWLFIRRFGAGPTNTEQQQ